MEKLLTTPEAAELLRIRPNSLEIWRCQRRGPSWVKVCGAIRYRLADLEAFIERGVVTIEKAEVNQ